MFKSINLILYFFKNSKFKLLGLLCLFIALSIIDLIGVSLLFPILNQLLVVAPNSNYLQSQFLSNIQNIFEGVSLELMFIIIVLGFSVRMLLGLCVGGTISLFVNSERRSAGVSAMVQYLSQNLSEQTNTNDAENIYRTQTLTSHLMSATEAFLKIISDMLIAIALLLFLFFAEPDVFLVLFLFFLSVIALIYFATKRKLISLGNKINQAETRVVTITQDAGKLFKELKVFEKENFIVNMLNSEFLMLQCYAVWAQILRSLPRHLLELTFISFFLGSWVFAISVGIDRNTIISVAISYAVVGLRLIPICTNISSLVSRLNILQDSLVSLLEKRFKESNGNQPFKSDIEIKDNQQNLSFQKLEFDKISFVYPKNSEPSFANVSLTINKGDIIGIVGASGIGKTTLLNAIAGLLKTSTGKIVLNSKKEIKQNLHKYVAYVPQETSLIQGTILQNICLLEKPDELSLNRAKSLIKIVGLTKIFEKSLVNENSLIQGVGELSGGQRQRIAIARALFHRRSILIFDEATNALDESSEKALIDKIVDRKEFGALVIVSHRPKILESCNKVYELKSTGCFEL